jgi:dienelactone hydrolase
VDKEVLIGKKPFQLGATLSIPRGRGPFPAVVLIHGSAAVDRNQFGLFKALAEGLSSQGVVVLRYDKRSSAYPRRHKAAEWTLEEEVLDDAVAALAFLRTMTAVDRRRIVVAGYSLGGMLAPAIAQRAGQVAGLMILAGPCRPIEQVLADQLEAARKDPDGLYRTLPALFIEEHDKLRRFHAGESRPDDLLWERSPRFWQSVNKVAPARQSEGLRRPLLVLQGGRDRHVSVRDLEAWRKLLKGRRDAEVREYPTLDHNFRRSDDSGVNQDRIEGEVVADVVKWVRTLRRSNEAPRK